MVFSIEADTAEELRREIVAWLQLQVIDQRKRPQRTISGRRWAQAQADAYQHASDFIAAIVIRPKNGGGQ